MLCTRGFSQDTCIDVPGLFRQYASGKARVGGRSVKTRPMRIAAFARGMGSKPTGRGMVAREMLQALRRVCPEVEIHLFSAEDPGWQGVTWRPASGGNLLRDAWTILRGVARDVAAIQPDVFWSATHLMPYGLPERVPKVVTLLDVVWRDHPETMKTGNRRAASRLERGLHQAHRIVCISAFTQSRLAHHWPKLASRSEVVYPAPSRTLGAGPVAVDGSPYLLSVDTLEPRKNLGILFDVLAQLPDLRLIQCGGTGWAVDELIRRAEKTPAITLRGYVCDSELGSLYQGALAAVFPSIYEGFHLSPLDAMSVGCPVIASDIPVHREILGDAALFVPSHDVEGWTAAIQLLSDSPERRARMMHAGRAQARRFSWDEAAAKLLRVFESVSERNR